MTDKVYFTSDPGVTAEHYLVFDGSEYKVMTKADPDASAGLGRVFRVMAMDITNDNPNR